MSVVYAGNSKLLETDNGHKTSFISRYGRGPLEEEKVFAEPLSKQVSVQNALP